MEKIQFKNIMNKTELHNLKEKIFSRYPHAQPKGCFKYKFGSYRFKWHVNDVAKIQHFKIKGLIETNEPEMITAALNIRKEELEEDVINLEKAENDEEMSKKIFLYRAIINVIEATLKGEIKEVGA